MAVFSKAEIENGKGRVNWDKIHATTEDDIERQRQEDGALEDAGPGRLVITGAYVRRIREKTGLTQDEFGARFGLSLRTVQEWEQGRAMPEGPARVLLQVIEREPDAVVRALKPEPRI
jgi:putative transcriptional regulator